MQARLTLAGTLKGIVSQRLLVRSDGVGRIPAVEVLVANGRVFDMIVNPDQTHMLEDVIREGDFYGMQTFDQHLIALVADGRVLLDEASAAATSPHDFALALQQRGIA
jgi:twitching motility protein PilT